MTTLELRPDGIYLVTPGVTYVYNTKNKTFVGNEQYLKPVLLLRKAEKLGCRNTHDVANRLLEQIAFEEGLMTSEVLEQILAD